MKTIPSRFGLLVLALVAVQAETNRLPPRLYPEIYAWFWLENLEFQGDGFRAIPDLVAERTNFNLLTTSLRSPRREVTLPEVHDRVRRGVEYAAQKGLRVALDLDVRLARGEFARRYPDQLQWMARVRRAKGPGRVEIPPLRLEDHMTALGGEYEVQRGRLLGVFAAGPGKAGRSGGLRELRAGYRVHEESARAVVVELAPSSGEAVVAAGFEYRTPDLFAPDLLAFQEAIYAQYRDVPLAGALKDEWGFPPTRDGGARNGNFWYSEWFAQAYRAAGGGDLLRDLVLMAYGWGGGEAQRLAAVNRYMRLTWRRAVETERHYYAATKRIFGKDAFTGTHATWGYMPEGDAFKNGYSWWQATRDLGQTDEFWPLPVRTALAKKMGSAVWFNQFYHRRVEPYAEEMWRAARAGGRMNVHPPWPSDMTLHTQAEFLSGPAMTAARRIRLLNYIATAPLDCPVAVVFGHPAALNWVGPHFGDLGVDIAEELWAAGVPADVIPSSEIETGALKIESGWVRYGPQRYRALVFVNPEFEPDATFSFLREAAAGRTRVWIRGAATRSPDGELRPAAAVPGAGAMASPAQVRQALRDWHSPPAPPPDLARLTDGTCIIARGERDPAGDPLDLDFSCGGVAVRAKARGVFAIRFARGGSLVSLAASGLEWLEAGQTRLRLARPLDLAVWTEDGARRGVVQSREPAPAEVRALASHWERLDPVPFGP